MKITVSVIKADVGGIGGHTLPSDGLLDSYNTKYDAVFIGYGEGELSLIDLEPNSSITVTTQFDIPYDDQMEYRVGIIPDRYGLQDYQERGFVCVKNCQN